MKIPLRWERIRRLLLVAAGASTLFAPVVSPEVIPKGTGVDMVRFDAILELSAPLVSTHVMLCARYWVSPKHYDVAFVWGEPAQGGLNFPTSPPTLTIQSNEEQFSLSNQFNPRNDVRFSKAFGHRGVFRYKFNNYPLENIRFAEPEALGSRLYVRDLEKMASQGENGWHTIDLADGAGQNQSDRDVARLDVRLIGGRIVSLKMLDANGQAIKRIEYEYSIGEGQQWLAGQNVLLPERLLTVGFNKGGAKVKIGDKVQTFKELPGTHHKGGRACTVEYARIKMGQEVVPLPACITVRHAGTNEVLRTARMSNFVQLKQTPEEAEEAVLQFGQFDDKELKVRGLFSKYWQKDPGEIEDADATQLKQLRVHFENLDVSTKTLGEQLKRINILMQLDLIKGNQAGLQRDFKEYLAILTARHLDKVALVGGLHVIDSTVSWSQFPAADQLLQEWIDTVIPRCSPESILAFGQVENKRRPSWTIARLLEECSKLCGDWDRKRFDAQALRCVSLSILVEVIEDSSKAKPTRMTAQADWASWSLGAEGLFRVAKESMAEAKHLFVSLDKPTGRQKTFKRQLDQMDAKLRGPTHE